MDWTEFVGIMASVFVLISFIFKNQLLIRCVNLVGCIVFVVYGILIKSLSIWLLNGILIFIQCYYIFKLFYDKRKNNQDTTHVS